MKIIILLLNILLIGCGSKEKINTPITNEITEYQIDKLIELKNNIKKWVNFCEYSDNNYFACDGNYNDGDALLFTGLLCLSGELDQCNTVSNSQDLNTGRVGRSPILINTKYENEFSRDMLLGELAYLIKTKDINLAKLHLNYIKDNNYSLCENPTDNRCDLNPIQYRVIWGLMKRVWEYIGLESTFEMKQGDFGDDLLLKLQSQFSNEGFQLHLVAVEILLRQKLNSYTEKLQEASNIIVERQENNPFFEYIANGRTKKSADLVLNLCLVNKPDNPTQWAWQRDVNEKAWKDSYGWDCIFMINLLIQE